MKQENGADRRERKAPGDQSRVSFQRALSRDRHLGGFHLLARVNNVAMNMNINIFFKFPFSILLGIYPEVELLDHLVILFNFLRNHHTAFYTGYTILHSQ